MRSFPRFRSRKAAITAMCAAALSLGAGFLASAGAQWSTPWSEQWGGKSSNARPADRGTRDGASRGADRNATPGVFDHYVLALSWSPGFCAREGDRKQRSQCDIGANLGFVVHGLWPQYAGPGYPRECGAGPRSPSRTAMREADGVFPDDGLARHQWRAHGTCSGNSPADYFRDTRKARDAVVIPDDYRTVAPGMRSDVMALKRAFVAANRGLRADMIDVSCNRAGLQEVFICFSKDLRSFTPCGDRGAPRCRSGFTVAPMR